MKALHLPLKEKWYRMIESGEKREEYREINPYWMKRLMRCYGKNECDEKGCAQICEGHTWKCYSGLQNKYCSSWVGWGTVHFTLGYPKKDDAERNMVFAIERITVGKGQPKWGAEKDKEYFVIKLGERL